MTEDQLEQEALGWLNVKGASPRYAVTSSRRHNIQL